MPVIKIRDKEEQKFAEFDVSENTVLIPLLRVEGNTLDTSGKLYRNVQTFYDDYKDVCALIDGEYDRSFIMAYELLLKGLNVVIKPIIFNGGNSESARIITEEDAIVFLRDAIREGAFEEFKNRNTFNIKFITTGAYANITTIDENIVESSEVEPDLESLGVSTLLAELAAERGDAIALLEFKRYFSDENELFNNVKLINLTENQALNSAVFFPWCNFTTSISNSDVYNHEMPACFAYLSAYASSVSVNANWFAAAGVTRGVIPNLYSNENLSPVLFEVGESLMHTLQSDYLSEEDLTYIVNPIMNAGVYGYRIWGNRVAHKGSVSKLMYRDFLNVRILLCDIKKQIYHTAMRVTFEPNDDIVWINFKTLSSTLLDRMRSGRGLDWYKWKKEIADDKATIKAVLTIKPIEAVESFDITVLLTDEEAAVSENDLQAEQNGTI